MALISPEPSCVHVAPPGDVTKTPPPIVPAKIAESLCANARTPRNARPLLSAIQSPPPLVLAKIPLPLVPA